MRREASRVEDEGDKKGKGPRWHQRPTHSGQIYRLTHGSFSGCWHRVAAIQQQHGPWSAPEPYVGVLCVPLWHLKIRYFMLRLANVRWNHKAAQNGVVVKLAVRSQRGRGGSALNTAQLQWVFWRLPAGAQTWFKHEEVFFLALMTHDGNKNLTQLFRMLSYASSVKAAPLGGRCTRGPLSPRLS